MKVIDDGVIKYDRSNFSQCSPFLWDEVKDLEYWRKTLYHLNLIGEYPLEKVGFGNVSQIKDYSSFFSSKLPQFLITGTQTGKYSDLTGEHYTRVLDYEIGRLKIKMMGPIEASSEALTHAAIYSSNKNIKAVFHIHSKKIWEGMIANDSDFTAESIPYGTVEMALATIHCVKDKNSGVFCMRGHEDGVVSYGRTMQEAGELILKLYKEYIE